MRRTILRNFSLYKRSTFLSPHSIISTSSKPSISLLPPSASATLQFPFNLRLFSAPSNDDGGDRSTQNPNLETAVIQTDAGEDRNVDISNEALKKRIEQYFKGEDEEKEIMSVFETVLARRMEGKHEDTDDEILDETRFGVRDHVSDEEFEDDFEEGHETDEEIKDLYDTRPIVIDRMNKDPSFHMDDKKWDEIVTDAIERGYVRDTKEMEDLLEDMLHWDKLLPDEMKKKVKAKFDELGELCEKQELEPEEAYKLFKEFEDGIVMEHMKQLEAEEPQQFDEVANSDKKVTLDDPPGEGPILRWQTRVVFGPGGDAWHPKNRKVKLSVTVKELGLSKHQFRRMREIVGKRYHPGRDELTITYERFEHREENRKDCLRTLLNIIEEAGKANKMAEAARVSYVKDRLKANPQFMARLHAKTRGLSAHA